MIILTTTAIVLLCLAVAALGFWTFVLVRTNLTLVSRPTVREGLGLPEPDGGRPTLSIVVPVHNEERLIDGCANLLRGQDYENLEIIFVLDRCTDGTAAILARHAAADRRLVLIENDSCPDDWAGKVHAAYLGSRRATGQWLLFTDADTRFDPRLCRAAMNLARARDLVLLSLLSTLTFAHHFERVAQVAASFLLLTLFPVQRINRVRPPRPFANGQFMLFRRDWHDRIGGHAALKDALLEDLAAAKLVRHHGGPAAVYFADGMLMCSMYDTSAAFEAGWRRIFIEACDRDPRQLRKWGWRTIASGTVLPAAQAAALLLAPIVAASGDVPLAITLAATVLAGWGAAAAVLVRIYALSRAPRWSIPLYPLGCLVVGRILLRGAVDLERGRPLHWGQRQYVLEPRSA